MDEIHVAAFPSRRDIAGDDDAPDGDSASAQSRVGCSCAPVPPVRHEYPAEQLDTEFKRMYPPDPFGQEMAPDARVWKVYRDEATAQDEAMLDGWSKTLDILLIFAGLFSAVATAFIVESYKSLQPDFAEYTARALFILVSARNASSLVPAPTLTDPSIFIVATRSRFINGFWFTSLSLSLSVALLCILVKQWLVQYKERITASCKSPQYWARRRSFYFTGLKTWRVHAIISVLPLLLHISLFLFLAGLVVLLVALDTAIALALAVLTSGLATFYIFCCFSPLWKLDFPGTTPVLESMLWMLSIFYLAIAGIVHSALEYYFNRDSSIPRDWASAWSSAKRYIRSGLLRASTTIRCSARTSIASPYIRRPLRMLHLHLSSAAAYQPSSRAAEYRHLARQCVTLDATTLQWMFQRCSASDVRAVASEATGALHPSSRLAMILRGMGDAAMSCIATASRPMPDNIVDAVAQAPQAARLMRAILCQCDPSTHWYSYY
ncbi:hypothetical protein EXIGLDRAFT_679811, partial [Exidia glandulosa HHB12029]